MLLDRNEDSMKEYYENKECRSYYIALYDTDDGTELKSTSSDE